MIVKTYAESINSTGETVSGIKTKFKNKTDEVNKKRMICYLGKEDMMQKMEKYIFYLKILDNIQDIIQ